MVNASSAISLENLVPGYPKLAGQMGLLPETAIFRRFGALNARNLLYLQAELVGLEKKLIELEYTDSKDPHGMKSQYALDWYWLNNSADDGDEEQLSLVRRIRETLREYNVALVQQSTILSLPEPSKWDLNDIQHYLTTKDMGPLALIGDDAAIWGSVLNPTSYCPDLVALRGRHNEDSFSKWVTEKMLLKLFLCGCAHWKKVSRRYGAVGYHDSTLLQVTFWITSILASLLPIASITILCFVKSMAARLGVIAAFNLILSLCLTAFTTAKRTDVFAVAAAFSAVQVVFVGTNGNNSINCYSS